MRDFLVFLNKHFLLKLYNFKFFKEKGCNFVTFCYNSKVICYKVVIFEGRFTVLKCYIEYAVKMLKRCFNTIKNSSDRVKKTTFAVVAAISIFAGLSFTGTRIAYKVNYSGHIIATVSNKNQFNEAVNLVVNLVDNKKVKSVVSEPKFTATVVLDEDINNTNELANAIIDNTDEIVEASTLYVDGVLVACSEKGIIEDAVNQRLNGYNVDGQECTSRFVEDVNIENGYFIKSETDGETAVQNAVNGLSVITEVKQITDVIVPYTTSVQKTNEQIIGYSEVSVSGVAGINRITQDIVMLNGEVQSCVEVGNQVVSEPVQEVIVKGTAKTLASAQQKQAAHNSGLAFPLPSGSWQVSSYYGDGRGHKGVDLRAKSGTSIYAALDGVVVFSGWYDAYGNCVIIEHSNGMRTLYAHAKQLCCNAGDTVSQGDIIALVGTTGQSSGNHLHFEIFLNGSNVDPAPYIYLD